MFVTNLFRGTHFFRIKRFLLNCAPGIKIGTNTKIVAPIWFGSVSQIEIGNNCFVNRNFSVEGNGKLTVNNNVDIGPNVHILTGGHLIGEADHRAGIGISYNVEIGDGVWIGSCSVLLGNIKIGNGCVVGADTLVNKSFDEDILIVGHPGYKKREI